jgi:hypothetical protein
MGEKKSSRKKVGATADLSDATLRELFVKMSSTEDDVQAIATAELEIMKRVRCT